MLKSAWRTLRRRVQRRARRRRGGGRIRSVPGVMLRLGVEKSSGSDCPARPWACRRTPAGGSGLSLYAGLMYLFGCIIAAMPRDGVGDLVWSSAIGAVSPLRWRVVPKLLARVPAIGS